jgi:hypothetical protein
MKYLLRIYEVSPHGGRVYLSTEHFFKKFEAEERGKQILASGYFVEAPINITFDEHRLLSIGIPGARLEVELFGEQPVVKEQRLDGLCGDDLVGKWVILDKEGYRGYCGLIMNYDIFKGYLFHKADLGYDFRVTLDEIGKLMEGQHD